MDQLRSEWSSFPLPRVVEPEVVLVSLSTRIGRSASTLASDWSVSAQPRVTINYTWRCRWPETNPRLATEAFRLFETQTIIRKTTNKECQTVISSSDIETRTKSYALRKVIKKKCEITLAGIFS